MEISGKIIQVLPERGGVSQRSGSEWKVASYVIETIEQYPKKCVFEVFGIDRIQQLNIQLGQMLTISFDIDAHEYNGRWYNTLRAWKADPYDPNAVAAPAAAPGFPPPASAPFAAPAAAGNAAAPAPADAPFPPAQPAAPAPAFGGESTDDLPF
ncbi:MAG: DUF3127 domain-containing protein [Bacteroidaceae bacterium]|nr:DUF3127 domain-containing protein [Bacteroidaceae bacterium]